MPAFDGYSVLSGRWRTRLVGDVSARLFLNSVSDSALGFLFKVIH